MREPIDVRGCFVDSPAQRKALNTSEDSVVSLDASIKNLIKFTNAGLDLATEYSSKNVAFAQELAAFGGISDSKEDPEISHMSDVFVDPIEKFVKDEVNPVKV
ncbi:MAG: hypothetical protein BJ554DRAFT_624 [Olpidium bornovanus]|uniref:BAR domain-containing protein n=1 Tax=Olpidium bornovanus TaxID=278681 RepID=A0A8H8DI02_9FUNG|nr:MAG: hypothetical protein BJ554DRAFT_624 [Olpidium bornovanus]